MSKNNALVTIVIGDNYSNIYYRYFYDSHKKFADSINCDLVVIDDYIDKSNNAKQRHPAWQKLLIFKHPTLKKYSRLCWIDADIFISNKNINPFKYVENDSWAGVKNNFFNIPKYKISDVTLYRQSKDPKKGKKLSVPDFIINTGFFIINKKEHKDVFEYIYKTYEEEVCYENGPLSFHLLNTHPGTLLTNAFNLIVHHYGETQSFSIFSLFNLVKNYQFIHFCGGINFKILKKVIFIDKIINSIGVRNNKIKIIDEII